MNDTLYTEEVRRLFQQLKLDFYGMGIRAFIAEEEANLNLVFFRDNFSSRDGEVQKHASELVKEFMETVRGMGIPIYMQVMEGDGRDKRP